jgi:hypothetical protein
MRSPSASRFLRRNFTAALQRGSGERRRAGKIACGPLVLQVSLVCSATAVGPESREEAQTRGGTQSNSGVNLVMIVSGAGTVRGR